MSLSQEFLTSLRSLHAHDVSNLLRATQDIELQFQPDSDDSGKLLAAKTQMICYLIENDLSSAKFLWLRSQTFQGDAEFAQIWAVCVNLTRRDYGASFLSLLHSSWTEDLRTLLSLLIDAIRKRNLDLIAKGYSSISIEDCSLLLGLDEQQIIQGVAKEGWEIVGKYVRPKPRPESTDVSPPEDSIQILTNIVVSLGEK